MSKLRDELEYLKEHAEDCRAFAIEQVKKKRKSKEFWRGIAQGYANMRVILNTRISVLDMKPPKRRAGEGKV